MEHGVRVSTLGETRARAVTHLDVTRSQVEEALQIIRLVASEIKG
jgi:threonine aldolase